MNQSPCGIPASYHTERLLRFYRSFILPFHNLFEETYVMEVCALLYGIVITNKVFIFILNFRSLGGYNFFFYFSYCNLVFFTINPVTGYILGLKFLFALQLA